MPVYRWPSCSLNSLKETARSLLASFLDCFAELGLPAMATPVVVSYRAKKRPREDYRPRRLRPLPVSGMCLQHDGTQYAIRSCPVGAAVSAAELQGFSRGSRTAL